MWLCIVRGEKKLPDVLLPSTWWCLPSLLIVKPRRCILGRNFQLPSARCPLCSVSLHSHLFTQKIKSEHIKTVQCNRIHISMWNYGWCKFKEQFYLRLPVSIAQDANVTAIDVCLPKRHKGSLPDRKVTNLWTFCSWVGGFWGLRVFSYDAFILTYCKSSNWEDANSCTAG